MVACYWFKVGGVSHFLWHYLWHYLFVIPVDCKHPQLPANQSGVKVLVAALGKSGTRTVNHALNDIGIRSYHSEDLALWPIREWALRMRKHHPENWHWTPGQWAWYLLSEPEAKAHEELAGALSRCGVEAVTLDGFELLTWPIYDLSPDVKVLWLNWRTFDQWSESMQAFVPKLLTMCNFNVFTSSSTYVIPWGIIVRLLDPLYGSPVATALADGGPVITELGGPLMFFYQQSLNYYNHYTTLMPRADGQSPLVFAEKKEDYEQIMNTVLEHVPPERYMEVDVRKTTYEDICSFLAVSPCPIQGKMPRAVNTWIWEVDFPIAGVVVCALRFFMHWVNWRLFVGARSYCRRRLSRGKEKTG